MIKKLLKFGFLSVLSAPICSLASNYEFSASGLFLRPGGSNDYAVLVSPFNPSVASPILSPSWEPKGINADFRSGFSLGLRRFFPDSATDISLYWAHMHASDSDTFSVNRDAPPAQQMTGPFWNIGPNAGPTSEANGHMKNSYDVVNIEVGKHIDFDPKLHARLFAGLSGLWLMQKIRADFAGIDPILGLYTFDISAKSKLNAAGMRLGLSGEYKSCYKINPVGMLAGNLYIGHLTPTTESFGTGAILAAAGMLENHQFIWHKHYTQIVPAIDAKLGLKYNHPLSKVGALSLEAGYMASVYINAIQSYVPSTFVPGSLGLVSGSFFLQSLMKNTDSFSVDGPYLTFALKC